MSSGVDNPKTTREKAISFATQIGALSKPDKAKEDGQSIQKVIKVYLIAITFGPIIHHLFATPSVLLSLYKHKFDEVSNVLLERNPVFFLLWNLLWLAGIVLFFVNVWVLPSLASTLAATIGFNAWGVLGLSIGLLYQYGHRFEAE